MRGFLTSVEQRDIGHAEAFTVRTPEGREIRFLADSQLNQTPGHLREHMTFGEPVVVRYRRDGAALVAMHVADADQ